MRHFVRCSPLRRATRIEKPHIPRDGRRTLRHLGVHLCPSGSAMPRGFTSRRERPSAWRMNRLGREAAFGADRVDDLRAWQARPMTDEFDADTTRKQLRKAVGLAIFGAVSIVVFALIAAFTDLIGLSGIGIGTAYLLLWGGRALWLLRKQRRSALSPTNFSGYGSPAVVFWSYCHLRRAEE